MTKKCVSAETFSDLVSTWDKHRILISPIVKRWVLWKKWVERKPPQGLLFILLSRNPSILLIPANDNGITFFSRKSNLELYILIFASHYLFFLTFWEPSVALPIGKAHIKRENRRNLATCNQRLFLRTFWGTHHNTLNSTPRTTIKAANRILVFPSLSNLQSEIMRIKFVGVCECLIFFGWLPEL